MRPRIRAWWPVVAWTLAIALFTLPAPLPGVPGAAFRLDKLVHFGLYLGLGWSLGRALWLTHRATAGAVLLALAGGMGFAAANEWAQKLSPTRVPSAADWLADTGGLSLGIALCLWLRLRGAAAAARPAPSERGGVREAAE